MEHHAVAALPSSSILVSNKHPSPTASHLILKGCLKSAANTRSHYTTLASLCLTSKPPRWAIMQNLGWGVHKVIKYFSNYYWLSAEGSMQIWSGGEAKTGVRNLSRAVMWLKPPPTTKTELHLFHFQSGVPRRLEGSGAQCKFSARKKISLLLLSPSAKFKAPRDGTKNKPHKFYHENFFFLCVCDLCSHHTDQEF